MPTSDCTCSWSEAHGVRVLRVRDEDCLRHGDDTQWWRVMLRRGERALAAAQADAKAK